MKLPRDLELKAITAYNKRRRCRYLYVKRAKLETTTSQDSLHSILCVFSAMCIRARTKSFSVIGRG